MFLSNRREKLLLPIICTVIFGACGSPESNDAKAAAPVAAKAPGEFPFSTIEPEVYQGIVTVSDGKTEKKWFVARRGELSRLDFYSGREVSHSKLVTDRTYLIDHKRRLYILTDEITTPGAAAETPVGVPDAIYRGKQYRKFEEIGRDNGRIHYRVTPDAFSKGEILISIDESSGMMVKQEFTDAAELGPAATFVYEMIDLKTEVADAVFELPAGYKKVAREEFYRSQKAIER